MSRPLVWARPVLRARLPQLRKRRSLLRLQASVPICLAPRLLPRQLALVLVLAAPPQSRSATPSTNQCKTDYSPSLPPQLQPMAEPHTSRRRHLGNLLLRDLQQTTEFLGAKRSQRLIINTSTDTPSFSARLRCGAIKSIFFKGTAYDIRSIDHQSIGGGER